jgi:hypothetical protein
MDEPIDAFSTFYLLTEPVHYNVFVRVIHLVIFFKIRRGISCNLPQLVISLRPDAGAFRVTSHITLQLYDAYLATAVVY